MSRLSAPLNLLGPIAGPEYSPESSTRLFSDFYSANSDWKFQKITAATSAAFSDPTYRPFYGVNPNFGGTVEITGTSGMLAGCRARICDSLTTETLSLAAGVAEMDFTIRLKWDRAATAGCIPWIGFFSTTTASTSVLVPSYGIGFRATGTADTWTAFSSANSFLGEGLVAPGVVNSSWNTLNVYINKAADLAIWNVNGVEILRSTLSLPSITNGQSTAANCFSVGAEIQTTATLTGAKTLTIDFMRFRYFHNRS